MKRTSPRHAQRPEVLRKTLRIQSRFGMAVVMALLVGQGASWASWVSSGGGSSSLVTAGALTVPGLPSPSQVPGGKTVSITWGAVSSATSYSVFYYTAAVGGTQTTACTTNGTSCVDPNARVVPAWYSVQARAGSNWLAESARVAYVPDMTTSVAISALGTDSGSSGSDFITNAAGNTLTGTSEAGASIVVMRSGSQIATATANGSGNWTSSSFTLNEELQNLDATATDAYANTATATQSNVRLDTVAPTTSQSSNCATGNAAPVGNWCKNVTLTMTATFSDAGSGLQLGTSQYNDNGVGWLNYSIPVLLAEANGRVVQLRATDIAGNIGTSSVTYYIDGTAPALSVTAPTPGLSLTVALLGSLLSTTCNGNLACGTSGDVISGLASVTSVKWKLNKGSTCYTAAGTTSCTGYAFQDAAGALPNWNVPRSYVGFYSAISTYAFSAQSTDRAGNVTTVSFSYTTLL